MFFRAVGTILGMVPADIAWNIWSKSKRILLEISNQTSSIPMRPKKLPVLQLILTSKQVSIRNSKHFRYLIKPNNWEALSPMFLALTCSRNWIEELLPTETVFKLNI